MKGYNFAGPYGEVERPPACGGLNILDGEEWEHNLCTYVKLRPIKLLQVRQSVQANFR